MEPMRKLEESLRMYERLRETNPYLYFELAWTRQTEWMCWVIDKQNGGRVVHAEGQGTLDEAVSVAHAALTRLEAAEIDWDEVAERRIARGEC